MNVAPQIFFRIILYVKRDYIPYAIERELINYLKNLFIQYYALKCNDDEECIRINLEKIAEVIPLDISDIDIDHVRKGHSRDSDELRKEILSTLQLLYDDGTVEFLKRMI